MTRRGFTLVEVMVALLVGAMVVAMAQRAFRMLTDSVSTLELHQEHDSRRAESRRWLADALGSVEVGIESASAFEGQPNELRCTTWLMGDRGWPERTNLEIGLAGSVLQLHTRNGTRDLALDVRSLEFDYLLTAGLESTWVRQWVSPISVPLAIRLRVTWDGGVDTTLVLVGGRG